MNICCLSLDDAKDALASVGVTGYEYITGELWVLCGQKRYGLHSSREIYFKHGYDNIDLKVNIPQGTIKYIFI
jgi:hypothetical protein